MRIEARLELSPAEVRGELEAALELKKVKDQKARRGLLKEATRLSLRELKERVRALLQKEAAPAPWHKAVASRLARVRLEALPEEHRALVEAKLRELEELLSVGEKEAAKNESL